METREEIQERVVSLVPPGASGRLLLAPRAGKTKIILDIIRRDAPRCILWAAPEARLLREDIPREFEKWGMADWLPRLTTVTWASLNKVRGSYDLIVLDEEQHATANRAATLLDGSLAGRTISMTGTPTQHWEKQDIYERLGLRVLYEMSVAEAVDGGILAGYGITVVRIPMSAERNVTAGRGKKKFLTSERDYHDWFDRKVREVSEGGGNTTPLVMARRRFVHASPSKLAVARRMLKLEGRKVFFCADIRQAQALGVPTYHSKTDDAAYRAFQRGGIDVLAMVNSGGTGHTYEGLDHLVLVQADSDKNGLTSQKMARALLRQEGYTASIWVLCLMGTRDEEWVASALQNFDPEKIRYMDI